MKYNWYACELHCHTMHSDGVFTPEELIRTAKKRMLDGIALTDHNTMSAVPFAEKCGELEEIALLPGMELTTFYGHCPVLKPKAYVEWRDLNYTDGDILVQRAKNAGALVGIAHPFQLGTPICTGGHWDYIVKDMSKVDYVEIWSEGCPFLNSSNRRAISLWHTYLDNGLHITPTMGRDWHRPDGNIYPAACTYLASCSSKLKAEDMLRAVKEGRTVISQGPCFTVEDENGNTVGDTVKQGMHTFTFKADYCRSDELNRDTPIMCRKIKVITDTERIFAEFDVEDKFTEFTAELCLNPHSWYSFELWGSIGEKNNELIAVTAAVFT